MTTTVGTSQVAGYQLQVEVGEVYPTTLRRRLWPGQASGWILGIPYTEESGVITDLFQSSGGGISGLADSGTRIVLRFSNVSVGQQVYVSTRPIAMSSGLDLRLTTGDQGGAGVFSEVPASSPSPAPGIAPVAIANGQGIAVYEVLQSDITAQEWARFGVVLQGGSGTPTVEAMCSPLTTSQQPWIPRFALPRTAPVITPAGVFRDFLNRVRLTEFGSQTIYNAGGHFSGKPGAAQDGDGNTWIVGRDTSNGL
ncbi:MAG: hypothetical protein JNN08_24680, partial [Bryobacterales bacterium]|nr:hypothetical protein [Bryobacterales bacterium]